VRGTNKQNQVLEESFETTKPFHQIIEDYFEAKCNSVKLHYERRNKQYSSIPTINRYQIVNLRVVTQSFVAIFLQKPYEAHRHEAFLLQKYAQKENNREIYNSDHSPYPYYISALIWYKFEDAFRRSVVSNGKSLRPYIAHLYYIFSFTTGQFPLNSKATVQALEKYCEKLEHLLLSDNFDEVFKKVEETFNRCKSEWINSGGNKFAIKDNKDFTKLTTEIAREIFVNKTIKLEDKALCVLKEDQWLVGEILSVKFNTNNWFAFIKTDEYDENVYFDHRNYKGQERNLVPGKKVRFLIDSKKEGNETLYFATKVEFA
jgi:HPt (histidine-containing phosphotransfer) domain-containing protein/cold shock CspA family protein